MPEKDLWGWPRCEPMRVLRRNEVDELFTPADALRVMRATFQAYAGGQVVLPSRLFVDVEEEGGSVAFMPALVKSSDALGMKSIALYPENPDRFQLPTILGSLLLIDARNGETLSLMDAAPITAKRTAAVSALATDLLARKEASVAGFVGSGVQAKSHAVAIARVRKLESVKVHSRTPSHADRFARWASETLGVQADPVKSPEEAVLASDIVTSATPAPSPILLGRWMEDGTHVNAIGSGPAMEVDAETYRRADKVVVDSKEHALSEARDVVSYIEEGEFSPGQLYAELSELVTRAKPGREAETEITFFRAVGLAMEDAAAARHVFDAAVRTDRGRDIPFP